MGEECPGVHTVSIFRLRVGWMRSFDIVEALLPARKLGWTAWRSVIIIVPVVWVIARAVANFFHGSDRLGFEWGAGGDIVLGGYHAHVMGGIVVRAVICVWNILIGFGLDSFLSSATSVAMTRVQSGMHVFWQRADMNEFTPIMAKRSSLYSLRGWHAQVQ